MTASRRRERVSLLGGVTSVANGINNIGQIVGWSLSAGGAQHAFLHSGGIMIDLNNFVTLPSGASAVDAFGINDLGQIAVAGSDGHAYLLTPAP